MPETDRPDWETDTVPTPRVHARASEPPAPPSPSGSDTLEMPAVRVETRRPRRAAPRGGDRPATAPRPTAPPARQRPRRRSGRVVLLGLALLAAAGAGVLAGRVVPIGSGEAPLAVATGAGEAVSEATWSSVDPVGGSGFRQVDARTWRTQSYRSPTFGNLKPGVGLLADVGSGRELSEVTVDVAPAGVVVELRAGDSPSQDPGDYEVVAEATEATGPTVLDASEGGAHRYWLVWVSQLGPREEGYVAELSDPAVRS
jgi:hypothetical protein